MDLELFAKVENSPPGSFKLFSAEDAGLEERVRQHLQAIDQIHDLIRRSVTMGFHIESISLRLQVIDYWLRLYFVNTQPPPRKRRKEFGHLLDQCSALGLDAALHKRLKSANRKRIDAIHGVVVGSIAYEALGSVADEFGELVIEVVAFVATNCGMVVTSRSQLAARPGSCVIDVEGFCREVRVGIRY